MGWLAYAILFGLVAGMMTFISFSELIVTALEYDTERKYVISLPLSTSVSNVTHLRGARGLLLIRPPPLAV